MPLRLIDQHTILTKHDISKKRRTRGAVAIACIIPAMFWSGLATATPDEDFMRERTILVTVRGVEPNVAASGFLWKKQNWVVTNLHAIPSDKHISVYCRPCTTCQKVNATAQVIKVLPEADLALLSVDAPRFGDKPPLHSCKPFTEADVHLVEPEKNAQLNSSGFLGNAPNSGELQMIKVGRDTLTGRIPRENNVMQELLNFGIPDVEKLDVYFVQGGSLPGYSGGPILDEQLRLVAIADGGLNEGQATLNWAIPVSNLRLLEDEGVKWEPRFGVKPEWLYSTGFADPDEYSVLQFRDQDWYDSDKHYDYDWVRTKRLSLRQLAKSSMDSEGILALLNIYGDAAGGNVDPIFDVYEDLEQGLIIAVPADQGLSMERTFEDDPRFESLRSEAVPEDAGEIEYRQTNRTVTSSTTGKQVSPNDPAFFNEKVSELLEECADFGQWSCQIDAATLRVIRFDNGDQILKVGIKKNRVDESVANQDHHKSYYSYYSFATRNGITFFAEASFLTPRGQAGLIQCATAPGSAACANPKMATTELSQMLAVHLTTFAYGDSWSGRSLETRIDFDSSADDPSTIRVAYFEGDNVRFFNSRGNIWLENDTWIETVTIDGVSSTGEISTTLEYIEYDRSSNYVYAFSLDSDEDRVKIPINGGKYRRSSDGGETWQRAGKLKRK